MPRLFTKTLPAAEPAADPPPPESELLPLPAAQEHPKHGKAGGFAQVFGLHPAIAVFTIAVDSMLFAGGGIMGLWASFWRSCFPCRWAAFGSLDTRHHLRRIWLSGLVVMNQWIDDATNNPFQKTRTTTIRSHLCH